MNASIAQPSLSKSLSRVAVVTAAILLLPLLAMQFTTEVNWTGSDFAIAAALLSLSGLAMIAAARTLRTPRSRLMAAAVIGLGLVYVWAELAVGIFTNLGS